MNFSSKVMTLNNSYSVPYLTHNSLSEIKFINHAFSTRLGGVSEGIFNSMNLAFNRGDDSEKVTENYKRFCRSADIDFNSLVASAQDHHTFVRAVTKADRGIGIYRPRDMQSVDALITNEPGVTLVTYFADCVPIFLVDVKNKAIGLAHAGWRGTIARIAGKTLEKMNGLYGTKPENIKAAIGPSINVCCYEVDGECAESFLNVPDLETGKFIFPKNNGKYMLNLPEVNRQILSSAGVLPENISVSDVCTCCNSDLLWSHRATNGKRGNLCAFMCIKET